MYKETLRQFTCWNCAAKGETENSGRYLQHVDKCYCKTTKRWGQLARGYYCEHFEFKLPVNANGDTTKNGYLIKNQQPLDYRTRNQWFAEGRRVKDGVEGVLMYSTKQYNNMYLYYLIEETEKIE